MTDHSPRSQLNQAYLSLGSNIQPERNLKSAVRLLSEAGRVRAASPVWETKPFGYAKQPNFLNAAILVETPHSARELQEYWIPKIEAALGRVRRGPKYGPRPIDIDLLLFNREILSIGNRSIPNPEVVTRSYVAIPLAAIAPEYIHPLVGLPLKEIAEKFSPALAEMRQREDVELQAQLEETIKEY